MEELSAVEETMIFEDAVKHLLLQLTRLMIK